MTVRPRVLIAGLILLACSAGVPAHQVTGGTHEHVWRQSDYGKDYRPGHSVNGPQGSITIWSPTTYNAYGAGKSVHFARPVPYSTPSPSQSSKSQSSTIQSNASGSDVPQSSVYQSNTPRIKSLSPRQYGKDYKRDYGK
jgi:hypothetical protein